VGSENSAIQRKGGEDPELTIILSEPTVRDWLRKKVFSKIPGVGREEKAA